jgi:DNA repair exonuclease SbcCD nuclease subunit
MAGHIHKFQEIKKEGVPIVYAGSLFQQDSGENITGHGYVVWNMEDMTYKHVEIENNYRIFKFKINDFNAFKEDKEEILNY